MKTKALNLIRILLGLFMIVIGLNKFFVFIEIPHPPGSGGTLMDIYMESGFLKLVGVLEIIGGIGLLLNQFTLIAVTVITAIMFNATVFHILYDPKGIGPALFSLLLCIVLVFTKKERPASFLNT
ncbi:DoxX family membrane protein [Flammeovirga sp. SJP92]|uniref:DoxX family membrane protein n=1 Tax=Flammeovirga sp. SJP92 TaxID=1775430 RepID=UPI0007870B66|nr:DoxX family membrane protein [Flammeovirga sp. SJP92]KXX70847.1 hypothetical protein AVL50_11435 [Flammeovirga sp. SJP92]